ncbi:MAG: SO_0444 family Cu/Zn efflux transporter, partial [Desulfobulbaceae bacterium]|nr:SO_0444 family Cu/Zn efflux transporter [Desulfobulbaceae bacterium]
MTYIYDILLASWHMLEQASFYMLFGLLVGGLLKVFLSPAYVARHLGTGRFSSVFKAALLGIPIPLCSCGVLPAAALLKKQGANNGATTAFLISTPESGVDSISITYALLDPIMTVARPIAAFISAFVAGISENLFNPPQTKPGVQADLSCPVDNCCEGVDCPPEEHRRHHSLLERLRTGLRYAATDLWGDLAGWFFAGILLAGIITVLVPDDFISRYLGGGMSSMLLMLAFGIPLYICATASTPIAAAFILKGVSPGTAL